MQINCWYHQIQMGAADKLDKLLKTNKVKCKKNI